MVWHLDLPPPSVVRAGVDRVGVVDVMAGVFCGVDGNVEPRVGISHKTHNLCTLLSLSLTHTHTQHHTTCTLHAHLL